MKRFLCTICAQIKRVRQLPPIVGSTEHVYKNGHIAGIAIGRCDRCAGATRPKAKVKP